MIMQTSRFATIETTTSREKNNLTKEQHNADAIIHERNHAKPNWK